MNNLQSFNFKGNDVRTVQIDGQPFFVAMDVTKILEIKNTTDTLKRLDSDEVTRFNLGGLSGVINVVNEYGLYSLILSSRKPEAKEFKRWITHEVIPSIRKNGAYMTNQKAYDITHNPDSLADLLLQAGEQLKRKDEQITEMTPKAEFADQISKSHDTILVRDLAKLLYKNGIAIGQNELFRWLQEKGYLIKQHNGYAPTQKATNLGVFEIRETPISHRYTQPTISITTLVTTKGQQYFINKFLKVNQKVEA